jgi:hypothetical protein
MHHNVAAGSAQRRFAGFAQPATGIESGCAGPRSMSTVSAVPRDQIPASLSALMGDWQWGTFGQPLSITYSFPTVPFDYRAIPFDRLENFEANFRAYAEAEKALVRVALSRWSDVARITFTELTGAEAAGATLRFAKVASFTPLLSEAPNDLAGIATTPAPQTQNGGPGQIWLAADLVARNDRLTLHTTVHEIGHALIGLLDISVAEPDGPNDSPYRSVMHYYEPSDLLFPGTSPMPADMEIARLLFGENPDVDLGDDTIILALDAFARVIVDRGGVDTLNVSGYAVYEIEGAPRYDQVINLNPGTWSKVASNRAALTPEGLGSMYLDHKTVIENVVAGARNDFIIPNAVANEITTGEGRDVVRWTPGSANGDRVTDFSAAHDRLLFEGFLNPEVTRSGERYTVRYDGGEETVTITAASNLVLRMVPDYRPEVARLYFAALDRVPDETGLAFWVDQRDGGQSLNQLAAQFRSSAEFKTLFGENPNDDQYVIRLYENVLDRAPDESGLAFWRGELTGGSATRDSLLVSFAESPENRATADSYLAVLLANTVPSFTLQPEVTA